MYPLKAIVVGCAEDELASVRRELASQAITLEGEFREPATALTHVDKFLESPCFFLVRVNSATDLAHLHRLNRTLPGKPIVALMNRDVDSAAVINTMRAGAAQILLLPPTTEDTKGVLETLTRQFGCLAHNSNVIAISGVNEGCGATTIALNLGAASANTFECSVAVVELSCRLGRLASQLELEPRFTTLDLLTGNETLDANVVQRSLTRVAERFFVLPGPYRTINPQAPSASATLQLIDILRQIVDVTILDMPYSFDELYFAVLEISDRILLVGQQNVPSLHAMTLLRDAIIQKAVGSQLHFVLNRYDPRDREFPIERMKKFLLTERLWTVANDFKGCHLATNEGKLLHDRTPDSPALADLHDLAATLLRRPPPARPANGWHWPRWIQKLT